jgi:hypothetical protein
VHGSPEQVPFKYVDDLATVWCEYAEMELRHKNFKRSIDIMRRATAPPDTAGSRRTQASPRPPCSAARRALWNAVPSPAQAEPLPTPPAWRSEPPSDGGASWRTPTLTHRPTD